jgi:hypothetical protein
MGIKKSAKNEIVGSTKGKKVKGAAAVGRGWI